RYARRIFSAADKSRSENRLPARTTSDGRRFKLERRSAAATALRGSLVIWNGRFSTLRLFHSAPLLLTPVMTGAISLVDSPRVVSAWGIPQRRVAITALLVEKAEPRMQLLQAPQRFKGLGNAVQATLVDGDQVQKVAVLGR